MQDATTWAALLGRWMDLAKAARALDGQDGGPWQRALPAIITYEALSQALPHIGELSVRERSYALDQAAVLLEARRSDMDDAFDELPPVVAEADAAVVATIAETRRSFAWTILWEGPDALAVPDIPGVPARGSREGAMAIMLPGTLALPGEPIAWWTGRDEPMLARGVAGCQAIPLDVTLQVWRHFDTSGRACEDRVRHTDDDGPSSAIPMLLPLVAGGEHLEVPELPPGWPPKDAGTIEPPPPVHWDAPREWFSD
ncbi:MAG TPA: hypothetical protein DEO92_01795 [Phycisphaerales bacterium]|nr:hypothetical protein [Phycisphaerales bacterium]